MDYSTRFLQRRGQDCTVATRDPPEESKCQIAPSSKSGFRVTDRHNFWEGIILSGTGLVAGDVVNVGSTDFLVFSVYNDPVAGVDKFMGAQRNLDIGWFRQTASTDANYNVITTWATVSADIPCFGQTVTAFLRQDDPGLLEDTKWLFHVPNVYNIQKMDRVVFGVVSCQVDYIDTLILDGIIRLQCSDDKRA